EKTRRFIDGQIENVGNVSAFIGDLERLAIIAFTAAYFAFDVNVRQKVHLNFDQPAAFAIFAAAAFNIEAEASCVVTAHSRGGKLTEQFADRRECTGVGDWIGPWRPANGALVYNHSLIDLLDAANRLI